MACRWNSSRLLLPAVAIWLSLAAQSLGSITANFDKYPQGAQACLYSSSKASNCVTRDTVQDLNDCLCGNTANFVTNAAACIGKSNYDDLDQTYSVMTDACSFSKTSLVVSQKDFMLAGNGTLESTSSSTASSTTRSSTKTSTKTSATATSTGQGAATTTSGSQPSNTNSADNGNTSSGGVAGAAKIGIIAGASVAGVAIVAATALFIIRYRRQRNGNEEAHPMLGDDGKGGGGGGGGGGGLGIHDTELARMSVMSGQTHYDWKGGAGGGEYAKFQSVASSSPGPYLSELSASSTPQPSPHVAQGAQRQPALFELPDQEPPRPAEMPASAVEGGQSAYQYQPQQQWPSTAYR